MAIKEQYKYSDITEKIIGCAMKVHRTLGNGFQEVIYQRALAIEMRKQNLDFVREMEMSVMYEGQQIGTRRVDFFVENKIMVELKALAQLEVENGEEENDYTAEDFIREQVEKSAAARQLSSNPFYKTYLSFFDTVQHFFFLKFT